MYCERILYGMQSAYNVFFVDGCVQEIFACSESPDWYLLGIQAGPGRETKGARLLFLEGTINSCRMDKKNNGRAISGTSQNDVARPLTSPLLIRL